MFGKLFSRLFVRTVAHTIECRPTRRRVTRRGVSFRTPLKLESLCDRIVPATYNWFLEGITAGSSETLANWRVNNQQPMEAPNSDDKIVFSTDGAPCNLEQTTYDAIVINSGYNKTITSHPSGLTLNGASASTIGGGTLNLQGHMSINGQMTITGTPTITGSTTRIIAVTSYGSLTISGTGTKTINEHIDNDGSLTLDANVQSAVDAYISNGPSAYMTLALGTSSAVNFSGKKVHFQNLGTAYVTDSFDILDGGFVNHPTGVFYIQASLNIKSSVTHSIASTNHTASLVNDGGEIYTYGGTTLTVDKSARIVGGTFYVLPNGTNYTATITGGNDFTQLLFSGSTLRFGQIGNGAGKLTLEVTGSNSVVHFENSGSMVVTLDYDNTASGTVDKLVCRNLVAGGGSLTVNAVGTRKAGQWKVVDCNPDLTLTQFNAYNLPAGVAKSLANNDIWLTDNGSDPEEEEEH